MKPILFNTEMVRAILEGRKNVTRRVANISTEIHCGCSTDDHEFVPDNFNHPEEKPTGFVCRKCGFGVAPPYCRVPCGTSLFRPRYWPGDILYVRETWAKLCYVDPDGYTHFDQSMYYYAADGAPDVTLVDDDGFELDDQRIRWKPSIHMPKEAARIFLRVTDVRVERLQDIDGEQAFLEGATAEVPGILESFEKNDVSIFPKNFSNWPAEKKEEWYRSTATASYIAQCELSERLIKSFKQIWDRTIPKHPNKFKSYPYYWKDNPWVWVYKFERISKEEVTNAEMQ